MSNDKTCVIIGASHAGVNVAFSLRKEGWKGKIILFDKDPNIPYHRPTLSKKYLELEDSIENNLLKPKESYINDRIDLKLGISVIDINSKEQFVSLDDSSTQNYDKLVFATGASAFIPPIKGINNNKNIFSIRNAKDVDGIRKALNTSASKKVVVIGGGYIGLETAASLQKMGANVTVLEREERILARVTTPYLSDFFNKLHKTNNVAIHTNKNVCEITNDTVLCDDSSSYEADIIIIGVGIRVNTKLAKQIGLKIEDGICVNTQTETSQKNIYAIGDCSYHYNSFYNRFIRLESVQNAVDQAKVAAKNICGINTEYKTLPWFWSDQYDIKLQIVGLATGYDNKVVRIENDKKFSIWYFKGNQLLAVDSINNAKSYVLGTKYIKTKAAIDKIELANPESDLKSIVVIKQN
ncbi:NAD(P)/FAD-dependent oxidoreductase [Tenacibaculum sp. M341]|uniref:NAD(P)/FAD-dependent oxidoreductase n=1 Tax=Tenacibaculum sp. M341 TaxID=2530339 RepID=UPI001050BB97|nr:FAD/NAD(P)-binding oxidoreductase [Tenacibaculum sp. M341]TCI94151.1 NAD(P)/FAD-dependent oxidoreductase [Tenacibaculum sp. M341]